MQKRWRALLASTVALVSAPAFILLATELAACYEMFSTGMNSRAELSDNLGFGVLMLMVVPPITRTLRHVALASVDCIPLGSPPLAYAFPTLTAQNLNSGIFPIGSSAAWVSKLAAAST